MQRMTAQNPVQLKIGDAVIENQTSAKLLGMRFEKNMSWQDIYMEIVAYSHPSIKGYF